MRWRIFATLVKQESLRRKEQKNAVNWHIWKNYGYVLFLIIATDSVKENQALYDECIHNLRTRLFGGACSLRNWDLEQKHICLCRDCFLCGGQKEICEIIKQH